MRQGRCWLYVSLLHEQPGNKPEGAFNSQGQPGPVRPGKAGCFKPREITAQDQKFSGENSAACILRPCRGKDSREKGEHGNGRNAFQRCGPSLQISSAKAHLVYAIPYYWVAIFSSMGMPAAVQETIEPSYICASLLPSSSDDTNQPIDAQCPVLQKLIWSPVVATPAAA